jgi:hypothetical protein
METYFKTFPQLSEFFKQSGQNALKFNYESLILKSEIL